MAHWRQGLDAVLTALAMARAPHSGGTDCEPELLDEAQVRAYVLRLREKSQAPSSINIAVCALRFFFTYTVQRDWGVFDLLRVKHPSKLPIVLSTTEVRTLLATVRHPVRGPQRAAAAASLARRALGDAVPEVPPGKRWVVFCKPTVQGAERVLEYLGRYVHRSALTDRALLHCDEQSVRFAYRCSTTRQCKVMTLPAMEFLRRFLQHVPAKGRENPIARC